MAKINVLEKQVAELIAAGEVVERPASIVKELVENAVDANASSVTVEIQGGGIRYIRVTDSGSGIEREDVANAFLRHATSKVRVQEDLSHITTMGFRGEALASIAAMCRVDLLTRTKDEVAGTHYAIAGGEEQICEDAGCPVGTTITVRDVFYNTPARMKFLKKDVSEGNSVVAVVEKAALANPHVAFKLIRDGTVKLQTPGDGQLLSAVRCVLGKDFSENTIPVHYEVGGLMLDGLISKPSFTRASRSLQNFFINTRFVRSKTCMAALEEAYRNALMVGKFPSCVLNLSIPPYAVDVNVHPAKIEVRFADEKGIFDLIYYGCRTALGATQLAPEIKAKPETYNPFVTPLEKGLPEQQRLTASEYRILTSSVTKGSVSQLQKTWLPYSKPTAEVPPSPRKLPGTPVEPVNRVTPSRSDGVPFPSDKDVPSLCHLASPPSPLDISYQESDKHFSPISETPEHLDVIPTVKQESEKHSGAQSLYDDVRLVGELFGTYLVIERENEMLLVDKHAAHERLLFNRLVASGVGEERQQLLTPVSVKLSTEEYSAVLEQLPMLEQSGIGAEDFGDGFILIREVAPVLADADLVGIVTEFADKLLHSNTHLFSQQLEELYHTIACRAAIKAHDKTEIPALEQLINLLREDGNVAHCPHGRPVAIRMSRHEIEKKFGRLG